MVFKGKIELTPGKRSVITINDEARIKIGKIAEQIDVPMGWLVSLMIMTTIEQDIIDLAQRSGLAPKRTGKTPIDFFPNVRFDLTKPLSEQQVVMPKPVKKKT